jgi:hypothetical protein
MRIACIGSREIPAEAADACQLMGMELVRAGYTVVTGATPGMPGLDEWAHWADGAFATGASHVSTARLIVCLPWQHFPRGSGAPPSGVKTEYAEEHPDWEEVASCFWQAERLDKAGPWLEVGRATRLRHIRNIGIILQSRLVLAWPHGAAEGTRFAIDFADWQGVPVIDLSLVLWREALDALLARAEAVVLAEQAG